MIRLKINLARITKNLFYFMEDVHRLCRGHKNFIFVFKHGDKLYLDTCKGIQNNYYICVKQDDTIILSVATLNYALALHADVHVTLKDKILYFDISSKKSKTIDKIRSFIDSIGLIL